MISTAEVREKISGMTDPPEAQSMNRNDGGDSNKPKASAAMTKKQMRGAKLQKEVQEERERNQKDSPPAEKRDSTVPNPVVDKVGNWLCCNGLFDKDSQLVRQCAYCAPCCRCCCGVSGANS